MKYSGARTVSDEINSVTSSRPRALNPTHCQ